MKVYKTLKEVLEAVKNGEIDESKLHVVMDNDCSTIYYGDCWEDEDGNDTTIFNGKGYYDIEDLYPLLFPKAQVNWC